MNRYFYPPRNFGAIPREFDDPRKARVLILPVPYDGTTTYKGGARDGPGAILEASQYLELYDHELGRETFRVGIHTLDDVEPVMAGPRQTVERVYRVVRRLLRRRESPPLVVMLGGEHSLSSGAVRAFRERYSELSVLQLDAHADLRDRHLGTDYSHACVGRRLWEMSASGGLVQVGVRSLSLEEAQFIAEKGLEPIFADEKGLTAQRIEGIVSRLGSAEGSPRREVYITIDLDVFDPSVMAAVGTPEPGGYGWYEVVTLLRRLAQEHRIVGFDLMELCPQEGPAANAFLAAKLAYKLIGYITSSAEGYATPS